MKHTSKHHEIVLFTGSGLASKQFNSKEENSNGKPFAAIEELEKACWNGVLFEMFPEILGSAYPKCKSFLWHVLSGKNYIYISIGPQPVNVDHEASIDPYFFSINNCEN
jgi:hypothetical protein